MMPNENARERLSATADARSSDRSERRLARFVWRDPRSGELLEVVLHGSESFFAELEALGFERTAKMDPGAPTLVAGLPGGSSGVRSSAARSTLRATPGSTPSPAARVSSVRSLDGIQAIEFFQRLRGYGC